MDKDKENALNLIRRSQQMNRTDAQAILKAQDKGEAVKSRAGNVKGWKYAGRFHSNPDFIKKILSPKQ